MNQANLNGIEIRPAQVGAPAGALHLTLTEVRSGRVVRSAEISAAELVRNRSFLFAVDRVAGSYGQWFELTVASSLHQPAGGVALWTTRGERLKNARFTINGVERWGTLAFRTRTPSTTSLIGRLAESSGAARARQLLILSGLVTVWALVGVILRRVAAIPEQHPLPERVG